MAKIIARCRNNDDKYYVGLRVFKRGVVNNAIPLDVVLTQTEWGQLDATMREAEKAQKSGGSVIFRDQLAQKLWEIKCGTDALLTQDDLTIQDIKKYVRSVIYDVPQVAKSAGEDLNVSLMVFIRQFISECESGDRLKQRSSRMVSASTIKNYKGTLAQLEAYERKKKTRLDWEDMTLDFYDDLKKFFLKKGYSPNTIGRHVKNLKIWLRAAKELKLTKTTDFESARFASDHVDVDNVYLTEERIEQLYQFSPTDREEVKRLIEAAPEEDREELKQQTTQGKARRNLEEAKDIFIVGCLTGQRVSDYKRISEEMYKTLRDGNEYLYLQQEKTRKWIYIPVDDRVRAILKKYGGRLPEIFDQHLNDRIKVVGHLLGWTEDAGVSEYHGLMQVPSGKKFYECIKTHTARRSFATNAYKNGIPLSSIMAITGHSSEQMLRKYLKLDNKERAILAAQDFAKVKKTGSN